MDKKHLFNNQIQKFDDNSKDISRRRFIFSSSAYALCLAIAPATLIGCSCSSVNEKTKIRVIYLLRAEVKEQPGWPNLGFDFRPAMETINNALTSKNIDFIPTLATGLMDAEKIVAQDKLSNIGGYIVYQFDAWDRAILTIALTEKPVLYVDFKYGGGGAFLAATSAFINSRFKWNFRNVGFVSSSRMDDMLVAVDCLNKVIRNGLTTEYSAETTKIRKSLTPTAEKYNPVVDKFKILSSKDCIYHLKYSKIIAVRDKKSENSSPIMGIPLSYVPFSELNEAWNDADKDEAEIIAKRWQKTALEVIDVSFETLKSSAAMYLGMKSLLKTHGANAITVDCLNGFYGRHINAYPCLGFHELCNEGLVGGCECDLSSTATMLAFSTLTYGRPGFISDPVIDTSKRQIIYAHCVASNKVFGPQGSANPFKIMTHSEDRLGASVRSILPVNYLTTTLKINNKRKEILLHQAVTVDNDPDDRACRTKLCAAPLGDMEKLFTMWNKWDWHRVTFYGDLKPAAYALADAIGWKVVEEA